MMNIPRPAFAVPPGGMPGMPGMPMPGMPGMPMPQPVPGFVQRVPRDRAQPVGKWAHLPPNNTIYVNNINEKLKREELVQSLRHVFGQFGKIVDIICYTKILKAKGQAFIVFDKVESATKALTEMQNFMFYNKPIRVSYAKTKSDAISKREGSFKPRLKRPREKKKKVKGEPTAKKLMTENSKQIMQRSNILIVSNLPDDANQTMIQMLFRKYPGYHSVTEPTGGSCRVKFDTESNALISLRAMQGFKFFNNVKLEVNFGPPEAPSIGTFVKKE